MEAVKRPAEVVREHIARYLGPFTSKTAVQMMAKQKLGTEPDGVTREQVPELLEALGPTLRTLLGKSGAETVAAEIKRELAL
jgi:hypothetical protein